MKLTENIKYVSIILFLMTGISCSYESFTITGKVVDESGNILRDVTVWACYSGWGWSEEGDYLVWDKNFCSKTTQTDNNGVYIITFNGPASSRLRAKKEGWIQTMDFNTTHSQIILTRSEVHSSRLKLEAKKRDLEQRVRRIEEPETDYYCRVIFPDTRPVNLNYQDKILSITPVLLENEDKHRALFTIQGLFMDVKKISNELVLKNNGKAQAANFIILPIEAGCNDDVRFIEVKIPRMNEWSDSGVEILVPSISAMFDMHVWN